MFGFSALALVMMLSVTATQVQKTRAEALARAQAEQVAAQQLSDTNVRFSQLKSKIADAQNQGIDISSVQSDETAILDAIGQKSYDLANKRIDQDAKTLSQLISAKQTRDAEAVRQAAEAAAAQATQVAQVAKQVVPVPAPEQKSAPVKTSKPKSTTTARPSSASSASRPANTASGQAPSSVINTPAPAAASPEVLAIIDAINQQRLANGLPAVRMNSSLNQAAAAKSFDMATKNYFAHTAPDGTTDWHFVDQAGYRYSSIGSNLAMGDFGSSQGLVQAWMSSPGHRANILASYGQEIGIGVYGNYYTMFIAKPM